MRWQRTVIALGVVLAGADVLVPHPGHLPPGTVMAFAVVGAVLLARGAKWLGQAGLQRPERPGEPREEAWTEGPDE